MDPKDIVKGTPMACFGWSRGGTTELMVSWAALLVPDKSQAVPQGSLEDDGGHYCQGGWELPWVGENEIGKVNSPLALRKFASGPDFCPSAPSAEASGGSTSIKWPESIEEIPLGPVRARNQKSPVAICRDHHRNVETSSPVGGDTQGSKQAARIPNRTPL